MRPLRRLWQRLARLRQASRGAATIEFAFMLTPMIYLLMGSVEVSYFAYSKVVMTGALREVARLASTGQYSIEQLNEAVYKKLKTVGIPKTGITTSVNSYAAFGSNVSKPEPVTSDVAPLGGTPGTGDCYLDYDKNNAWSQNTTGGPDDILRFAVTAKYKLLFKFNEKVMGGSDGYVQLDGNTTIKNEPFTAPPEKCIA